MQATMNNFTSIQISSFYPYYYAAVYDCSAYGTSVYNSDEPCDTALAGTGTPIIGGIVAGILLIIVGLTIVFSIRRKKKSAKQ